MIKRAFDILASTTALLLLLPLFLLLALAVALSSPGGAFFRQVRVGKEGRNFSLLKFRTMRPGSEAKGQITVGGRDPRITGIGYVLRKSKLDELPQLLNVLLGDMSIVGPRPEVPKYVALYSAEQREVLSVRPGITSLASIAYINENEVLGRSSDPERTYIEEVMPAKLALDLEYVKEKGLFRDFKIILGTLRRLLTA
ncbi:MAG TPA: sugar transferase [Flavobacteriales bacterium]|nr:sugar transferase [Flavobacteriales bacterium]